MTQSYHGAVYKLVSFRATHDLMLTDCSYFVKKL